jgi:hypothetical protein
VAKLMGIRLSFRSSALRFAALAAGVALCMENSAEAAMQRSLFRSPEALAMGDAYTAIVEGRDAPFYNPAGVAAIDGLSVHWATLDATVSDWLVTGWESMKDVKDPSGADLNRLMGENIYVQGAGSAAVLAPGFALIGFYDAQGALYAKNQALPKIEYGYQTTSGIQAAFGFALADGRRRGKGRRNAELMNEWRFGIGGKFLTRTGGYRLLSAAELFTINDSDADSFVGGKGTGYGLDFGIQRVQKINSKFHLHWGAAYLNAGDVHFAGGPSPVKADVSTGLGVTFKQGLAKVTVAYDLHQLNREDDFSKKQNIGIRLGLPLFNLYAGLHQGFLTYGAAFDIWLLRIAASVYKEELGAYSKQDTESRMALRIDLKMDF